MSAVQLWLIVGHGGLLVKQRAAAVTGTSAGPLASRNAISNSWAFRPATVSRCPPPMLTSFAVQLRRCRSSALSKPCCRWHRSPSTAAEQDARADPQAIPRCRPVTLRRRRSCRIQRSPAALCGFAEMAKSSAPPWPPSAPAARPPRGGSISAQCRHGRGSFSFVLRQGQRVAVVGNVHRKDQQH